MVIIRSPFGSVCYISEILLLDSCCTKHTPPTQNKKQSILWIYNYPGPAAFSALGTLLISTCNTMFIPKIGQQLCSCYRKVLSLGINVIFYFNAIITVKVASQGEKKNVRNKEEMMQRGKIIGCLT